MRERNERSANGRHGSPMLERRFARFLSYLALIALGACASEQDKSQGEKKSADASGATDAPTVKAVRQLQQALGEESWAKELQNNAELATLAAAVDSKWQAAGVIEDDDEGRVIWAEYATAATAGREDVKVVFRVDAPKELGGGSTIGQGSHTATGVTLQDASGAALNQVDVARPLLLKEALKGQGEGHPTILYRGLSQKTILKPEVAKTLFDAGAWGKRRFVLFNAYGPEVGVRPAQLLAAAKKSDRFDEVLELNFVRQEDITRLLPTLSPLDVVVWFGAGVIETYKGGKSPKSVGMTVSRGIFGDAYFHRDLLQDLFQYPPLGGPGLMILAGSDTLYSNSAGLTGVFASYLRAYPFRPVIGFEGKMSAEAVDTTVAALLSSLLGGATLEQSMEAADKIGDAQANCLMEAETRKKWILPEADEDLLGKQAKSGELQLYMSINPPLCVDLGPQAACNLITFEAGTKTGKEVPAAKLTSFHATFRCDLTFKGPFFSCDKLSAATGADFKVRGVLQGAGLGRQVAIYVTGSASNKVKNVAMVGMGTITSSDTGGGTTSLSFAGPAVSSTYVDAHNYCCISKNPTMSSNTSKASTLTF